MAKKLDEGGWVIWSDCDFEQEEKDVLDLIEEGNRHWARLTTKLMPEGYEND